MRWTATVSGKTESCSGSSRSMIGDDVDAEAAGRAGDLADALGAGAAAVQRDEPVARPQRHAGPCSSCSAERPSVAT